MIGKRCKLIFILLPLMICFPPSLYAGGDIQITCEPGVRIWLNDQFMGKTTADDFGMFVENLRSGEYVLKAAKSGFKPFRKSVEVVDLKTIEVRIEFKKKSLAIEDYSERDDAIVEVETGTLILRSVPLYADIYLNEEHIGQADKKIKNLGSGEHKIVFIMGNKELEGNFDLEPGDTLRLKAHFKKNLIINETEQESVRKAELPKNEQTASPTGTITEPLPGMKFVWIPPGSFLMGSPPGERGRRHNEAQHLVTLTKGFYLQTTEVTQGQWKEVMGDNPSYFSSCGEDCPVERVSWEDVQEFIRRLNQRENSNRYRLPTEAEWEYAARAGSTTAFANGEIRDTGCRDPNLDKIGWYCGNSGEKTHPVARKQPNAWGLHDMHGNVWEWCRDWEGDYPSAAVTDPTGPLSGEYRVVRGGSWTRGARRCRSAFRGAALPGGLDLRLGFRLARTR